MESSRSVTLIEVARRAGVSNATVSVVLNGSASNVRVSDATRQRVLAVAQQMGYRPNSVAQSLRRKRTNVIGLYCGYGYLDTSLPFFAQVIGGLQQGCDTYRKDLLLHGGFPERPAADIYSELVDGRIDGLVVYAPAHDALVGRLAASHLPVVSIVDALAELPSVGVDDAAGSRMLMEHLWRQGHRRVIYWSAWRSMTASEIRRAAFLDAAALQGMVVQEWNPGDTTEATSALVTEWLQTPRSRRATAVVCWHDAVAYKLLAQCRMRDVRVPEDLAVVGFDGMPSPFGTALRLTTVLAPWLEVARAAVSLLVKSLDGEMPPEETVLPVEFIRGETS